MTYNPEKHHRRSIRLKGYDYASAGAYFITLCTHQRQCLFGDIAEGEMQLNEFGKMVNACWQRLPFHFPNVQLDAFVVMPNHIHGILILTDQPRRGAALGQDSENPTDPVEPNATPNSNRSSSESDAALGQDSENPTDPVEPNATPNPNRSSSESDAALENESLNFSEPGVAFGRIGPGHTQGNLPNAAPPRARLDAGSVGAVVLNFKSVTTRSFNRIRRSPGTQIWQRNYYEHVVRNEESLQRIRHYIHQNPMSWYQDRLNSRNSPKR